MVRQCSSRYTPEENLSLIDGRLVFDFDYDQHIVNAVKGINGRAWDSKNKVWTVPTISTKEAITVARHFDFGDSKGQHADDVVAKGTHCKLLQKPRTLTSLVQQWWSRTATIPEGVACYRCKRCFIADEMGLGKTVQALASIQHQKSYPAL